MRSTPLAALALFLGILLLLPGCELVNDLFGGGDGGSADGGGVIEDPPIDHPVTRWSLRDGQAEPWDEELADVVQVWPGDYVAVGRAFHYDTRATSAVVIRTDWDGALLWSRTYAHERGKIANAVARLPGGEVLIAGQVGNGALPNTNDGWLARLDAAGEVVWEQVWDQDSRGEHLLDVLPTADGGIVAVGARQSPDTPAFTVAFVWFLDSSGNLLSEDEMDVAWYSGDYDTAVAVVERPEGGIRVAGYSRDSGQHSDAWVLGYDAGGGRSFERLYQTDGPLEAVTGAALGDADQLILVGSVENAGEYDLWSTRVSALDGSLEADLTVSLPGTSESAADVAPLPDGGFVLAGRRGPPYPNGMVTRLDSGGQGMWSAAVGPATEAIYFSGIAAAADAGFIAVGARSEHVAVDPTGVDDAILVKLDETGACDACF